MGMAFRIIFALLFIGILAFSALKVQQLFSVSSGKAPSRNRTIPAALRIPGPAKPLKFISMDERSPNVKVDRISNTSKPLKAAPGTAVLIEKKSGKRFSVETKD